MSSLAHHLLEVCRLKEVGLIFVHELLPVQLLIHLVREILEHYIHHDLAVGVSRVDEMVHIQALGAVEPAHYIVEGHSVYRYLGIQRALGSKVVDGSPINEASYEGLHEKGGHAC